MEHKLVQLTDEQEEVKSTEECFKLHDGAIITVSDTLIRTCRMCTA